MIQFNLLPDVKVQYIKAQRLKRTIMAMSILATAASVLILLFSFSYSTMQSRHISNLDSDISRLKAELDAIPELSKILSVQNQLNTLPTLYNGRPAVDRLPIFIDQTTPSGVGIGLLSIDFTASTIEISGQAETLEQVNSYVDTLKFTTFKPDGGDALNAFSGVVLTRFGKDKDGASFMVSFSFDPQIFDVTKEVILSVPRLTTTRAAEVSPDELFDGSNQVPREREEAQNGDQ